VLRGESVLIGIRQLLWVREPLRENPVECLALFVTLSHSVLSISGYVSVIMWLEEEINDGICVQVVNLFYFKCTQRVVTEPQMVQ